MRTLKQLLCRHYWVCMGKNTIVNEALEQCAKCGVYNVWHRGINAEYTSDKFPTNKGWEHIGKEGEEID